MTEAPCEVWFYHLERAELEQVLPELLEKTLARGWKALVRCASVDRVEHLDTWLWSYRDDSFLPHGLAGEGEADRQPVLLTTDQDNINGADVLFLIDDADPGEISAFSRCILIFDGRDDAALVAARKRWSTIKSAGWPVAYWRQGEARGWVRQA